MAVFAVGTVTNSILTVSSVELLSGLLAANIAPELLTGGKQAVVVPESVFQGLAAGAWGLIGRDLDISTPTAPTLVDNTPTDAQVKAGQREFLYRAAQTAYTNNKPHWPDLVDQSTVEAREQARRAVNLWVYSTTAAYDVQIEGTWRNSAGDMVNLTQTQLWDNLNGWDRVCRETDPAAALSIFSWYRLLARDESLAWANQDVSDGAIVYTDTINTDTGLINSSFRRNWQSQVPNRIPDNFTTERPTLRTS